MMSKLSVCAATALALVGSTAAFAQNTDRDLSYTWLEVDYINLDVDGFDDDEDLIEDMDDGGGWGVDGSFAFTPMFFGFAGYSDTESDVTFVDDDNFLIVSDGDIQRFHVGLGLNMPMPIASLDTDLVLRAAYHDIDYGSFDFGASDDSDVSDLDDDSSDGWSADARFRGQLTPWLEASLGVGYLDIEETDGFSVLGNLLFELNEQFGINLAADVGDEVSTYALGLRYSFNRF